jgi:hypothetical protein
MAMETRFRLWQASKIQVKSVQRNLNRLGCRDGQKLYIKRRQYDGTMKIEATRRDSEIARV